jgi:hypothetical protein
MWYSVEILENKEIFVQKTEQRLKHGAKGVVLLPHCTKKFAENIKNENTLSN